MPETQTLPDDFIVSWSEAIGIMPQNHFFGVMAVLDEALKLGREKAFEILGMGTPEKPRFEKIGPSLRQLNNPNLKDDFPDTLPIDLTDGQLKRVTALMHGYHAKFRVGVATKAYEPKLGAIIEREIKVQEDDIVLKIWWRTLHFVRRTLKCVFEMEKDSEETTTVINELFRLASLTRQAFEEGDTSIMNLDARLIYNFQLAKLLEDRPNGRPKPIPIRQELELFNLYPLARSRDTSFSQQDREIFRKLAYSALTIIYHQVMHYVFYSGGFERINLYKLRLIASAADLGGVYSEPR